MDGQPSDAIHAEIQTAIVAGAYRQALELLAHTYLDTVYAYCLRMLHGDAGRAKDVTQQVFEEVCHGITAFRGEASAKTWLLAIARNQCLKDITVRERRGSLLRQHHEEVVERVHVASPRGSEAMLLSREGLERLQEALDRLDPDTRSMLILRFGLGEPHEVSVDEIAGMLGLSRATAYRKLQQALARLKRMLHDDAT